MKTIIYTEATAEEIKRTVEDTCGAEGLEFRITELGEHLVIEVATINQCCHQNKPGVWWGIWVTDEFSGEPRHAADEEHLCPGCEFDADRNSHLASAVIVDLADPGIWAAQFAAAVKECVDWRGEWRDERRARAAQMLEREIAQRLAAGLELATNSEAGTEDDPDSNGAYWSIWQEGDKVFGWKGWGDDSGIEDVTVEHPLPWTIETNLGDGFYRSCVFASREEAQQYIDGLLAEMKLVPGLRDHCLRMWPTLA